MLTWVDDIIMAASSINCMTTTKDLLKNNYKMKDLGTINFFLGIAFVQKIDGIEMNQTRYLSNVLERYGMGQCKPCSTPCELKTSALINPNKLPDESPRRYCEIVGSLIYAMICTRPDLCWIVSKLSQDLDKPDNADWIMIKLVLRFIQGT
jgi:hypothetical protein